MATLNFGDFLFDRYLRKAEDLLTSFNREMSSLTSKETSFCKERCAFCCHHIFFLTNAEVDVATNYLLNHEPILEHFIEKCKQREIEISKHMDIVNACNDKGEAGNNAAIEFMKLNIPCSFLDNDLCSIYPVRPMVCSSFVSIIPASVCKAAPKSFMSNRMRALFSDKKKDLKNLMKSIKINPNETLDISHQVFARLKGLGKI